MPQIVSRQCKTMVLLNTPQNLCSIVSMDTQHKLQNAVDLVTNVAFELRIDGQKNYNYYHTVSEAGPVPCQRHLAKRIPFSKRKHRRRNADGSLALGKELRDAGIDVPLDPDGIDDALPDEDWLEEKAKRLGYTPDLVLPGSRPESPRPGSKEGKTKDPKVKTGKSHGRPGSSDHAKKATALRTDGRGGKRSPRPGDGGATLMPMYGLAQSARDKLPPADRARLLEQRYRRRDEESPTVGRVVYYGPLAEEMPGMPKLEILGPFYAEELFELERKGDRNAILTEWVHQLTMTYIGNKWLVVKKPMSGP